jgi:hypothetical protein
MAPLAVTSGLYLAVVVKVGITIPGSCLLFRSMLGRHFGPTMSLPIRPTVELSGSTRGTKLPSRRC